MLENREIREIDFSRAMGLESPNRAGFSGLSVSVAFEADMTSDGKKEFLDRVFRRGTAIDNVMNGTPVAYRISE